METGYDILFFWVARMMMMGCYLTGTEPFHTIYLHGLVRDKDGRKMSKSYGNVVNPLEVMDQHGTDALRFTLTTSGTPGQDLNLNPERIEAARNFANKLWNITRFVISKLGSDWKANDSVVVGSSCLQRYPYTLADRWIMSRYTHLIGEVDRLRRACNFAEAWRQSQEFLWSQFADWYVEIAKVQLDGDEQRQHLTREVLYTVLEGSLRLLHPFMPFVTEEAWQYLIRGQGPGIGGQASASPTPDPRSLIPSIMISAYPVAETGAFDEAAERDLALLQEVIVGIRNVRNEYKVEPARYIAATIMAGERTAMLATQRALIVRLARVVGDQLAFAERLAEEPQAAATLVIGDVEVVLPLAGLIDLD